MRRTFEVRIASLKLCETLKPSETLKLLETLKH